MRIVGKSDIVQILAAVLIQILNRSSRREGALGRCWRRCRSRAAFRVTRGKPLTQRAQSEKDRLTIFFLIKHHGIDIISFKLQIYNAVYLC